MPIELKGRKNNLQNVEKAARLRARDYSEQDLTKKEEDRRVSSLLAEQAFNFVPNLEANQPLSSHQMREFLRDTRFLINLNNTDLSELDSDIDQFIRRALNNIQLLQKDTDALDASTVEAELRIAKNVDVAHFNSFVREKDMPLEQNDSRWIEDYKTTISFDRSQLLKVYPGAGATLPIVAQVPVPIVDAQLVGEETDVGDTTQPLISTNPRFVFLRDKIFRHVIIRKEFDPTGTKINRTPSKLTFLLSLSNIQLVNFLQLTPASSSTFLIEEVSYINEVGEEIVLNSVEIDAGVNLTIFFEPIKAKYFKVKLVQYAPVQKLAKYVEDPGVAEINKLLDGLSWQSRISSKGEYIEGRVFDFSIQNISLGLNQYEKNGLFRAKNLRASGVGSIAIRNTLDSVPIISRANGSIVDQVLGSAEPSIEFYAGIEARDRSGRLVLSDLIPLVDDYPTQSEYLPLIGGVGILKFFPDFFWNITKQRILTVVSLGSSQWEVTLETPHAYEVGDVVSVLGSSNHSLNSEYTITAVGGDYSVTILSSASGLEVGTNDTPYLYLYKTNALVDDIPIRVYRNNNLLTFGTDYKIGFGTSPVFSSVFPTGSEWISLQEDVRSGRCHIQIVDPRYEDIYRVEYRPLSNQYLGKTKLVRMRNGRVVFDKRLRRSRFIINTVAIMRSGFDNPYITPILRSYTLQLNTFE